MIIDCTGTRLTPGNLGRDCDGDGRHYDKNGQVIECCCDECAYYICCMSTFSDTNCKNCKDIHCPHSPRNPFNFFKRIFSK